MTKHCCFVTGATGLVGHEVVARLLASPDVERVYVLARGGTSGSRVTATPLHGDLRLDGLGIAPDVRARLAREVTTVVHLAANTSFSQSLDEARATNTDGTRRLLQLSDDWTHVSRWVYVSTAFVAGLRTGTILENDPLPVSGWANDYEQSKAEAEGLVRGARADWVVARPATIVAADSPGRSR